MAWFDRNPGNKKPVGPEPEKPREAEREAPKAPLPQLVANVTPEVKQPRPIAESGLTGHLHKGSRVTGQLFFQGGARIDGIVDGEIRCNGTLTIGEGAEVRAKISGQAVVIRGKVEGNVTAKERVELLAPARLYGDITSPRLVITEGVVFDGDCSMGVAKSKAQVAGSQSANIEKVSPVQPAKHNSDSGS